ncbi:MAG TPA: MBL fold metallo-hydrolase [Patescibacteria group bacterium]|nr:MBL fold metallo-hydrolase [Patescibacteria group bacterium]
MQVKWYGGSSLKIKTNQKTILVDPFSAKELGLRGPKFNADIMLFTKKERVKNLDKKSKKDSFIIDSPGEYTVKDIMVYGINCSNSESLTVFNIEIKGVRYGILGELNKELTEKEVEGVDGIDVLFVPVGGNFVLEPEQARDIISLFEPSFVLPTCYKIPGVEKDLSGVDKFLKQSGIKKQEKTNTFSIKSSDLSSEESKIIVLES